MTDVLWQAVIAGVVTCVLAYIQLQTRKAIKDNTDVTNDIKVVTTDTHGLVNSNMGIQLQLNAALSRRIAELTKDPADIAAALESLKVYEAHIAKQAKVDAAKAG